MASFSVLILVLITGFAKQANAVPDNHFQTYYYTQWGGDHVAVNPDGTAVQLKFDNTSGGGGFRSKLEYSSGFFHIRMKIPDKKTGGLNTNFYLTSLPTYGDNSHHFELDFEFLGTNGTVQTNVYDNDGGGREQSFNLWFNPSQDFHSYDILWNSHEIVFYIDNTPIRVFKNNEGKGIVYPNNPMHVEASIWNAAWAGQIDWTQVPYIAYYTDFGFNACSGSDCASDNYFWNGRQYWDLDPAQKSTMDTYRKSHMVYDYCSKPETRKKECELN